MTWRTHTLTGIASLWALAPVPGGLTVSNAGLLIALAAFGALLPDLDAEESKLKSLGVGGIQPFALPAEALHRTLGHRGFLHSFLGLTLFAALTLPLLFWGGWRPFVALTLGYASHLGMDACTPSGIPMLYPNKRRYHLLPRGWRISTGSFAEQTLMPFLAVVVLLLLLQVLGSLLLQARVM